MCYPKPGPRCSGHAEEELVKRADELRAAQSKGLAVSRDAVGAAYGRFFAAQEEYDSTPNGIKDLEQELESTIDEEKIEELSGRIDRGKYRRALRMEMMDSMIAENERVSSDTVHQDDNNVGNRGRVETSRDTAPQEIFPDSYVHPELGQFNVSDNWDGNDFSYIRIETSRPLSDDDMNQMAGLTGYAWRRMGAERLSQPTRDGERAFTVFADSTKSGSDDFVTAIRQFEEKVEDYTKEGSPKRKTKNDTRLIEGFGSDTDVKVYYSEN